MKAVTWQGKQKMEIRNVDDPKILAPTDAIIRITATAICGSDLHLYHHGESVMEKGYVVGHEPMGIVEEVGSEVKKLKKGQRVVIPFNISCGHCHFCANHMESQCDNSNQEELYGGLFGFGKLNGNHWGGQAEYLRVPFADSTSFVVPDNDLPDEKVLFLSDILPTAYWSVANAGVKKDATVVVLGSGPVGLFAQKFAVMAGAKRVIAVDPVEHRLDKAVRYNQIETYLLDDINQAGDDLYELARGGADVIIDCVGMDGLEPTKEKAKNLVSLQSGTISPIQMAAKAVKKFGTVQITGVYMTPASSYPLQEFFMRNIDVKHGQAPVVHLMPKIYNMIAEGLFDPTQIITHSMPLEEAARAYEIFDKKEDKNIKVVLKP
ncbi:alcohol dehydrogenase catalytic domain-containing protein [Enterococcus sp. DIV1298c]|uniref:alcohol dehydrogenase catalytic domain-containing protein n=1 Tax=Enterococcus sp. DIV1298c TaxID=2815328 RepID=UPI001A928F64|nr:alcohol dehydrogenase catalytic domain-containing protein [Enterococcus sp. DIV1298c]MBO0460241.1 alcohol dehydrogenase catalytic domain-containing protein [Enterococcus sp. DIV1298c]